MFDYSLHWLIVISGFPRGSIASSLSRPKSDFVSVASIEWSISSSSEM